MITKIVIAGGNGFLGTVLADYFQGKAKEIVILARKKIEVSKNIRWSYWDGENIGDWLKELEDADVLINLAGKSVDCRYTEENKKLIYDSRLNSTRILGKAIEQCIHPPELWINASSATIYRASWTKMMTEDTGETGDDFSMDVCKQWEAAFNSFNLPHTRKVILRIAIVLGKKGGALQPLMNLVRFGLGGKQGNGKQYFSWIHQRDFCRVIEFMIDQPHAAGVYNTAAPQSLPNKHFMKALQTAMKFPFAIGIPVWLLKVGAIFIRTETELILKSRKVYPKRLLDEGFVFEFAELNAALEELCQTESKKN